MAKRGEFRLYFGVHFKRIFLFPKIFYEGIFWEHLYQVYSRGNFSKVKRFCKAK